MPIECKQALCSYLLKTHSLNYSVFCAVLAISMEFSRVHFCVADFGSRWRLPALLTPAFSRSAATGLELFRRLRGCA
jgi:hypothetical protein